MQIGDRIQLYNGHGKQLWVEIVELREFLSIRDAYQTLGRCMAPGLKDWDEVRAEYLKIFSLEDQALNMILAVGIKVLRYD